MSRLYGSEKVREIVDKAVNQDWEWFELKAAAEIILKIRKAEELKNKKKHVPTAEQATVGISDQSDSTEITSSSSTCKRRDVASL